MALPSVKHITTANDILGLPNFAIVRIPEGGDIIKLFSLLLNNGFPEVSFVNEIRENAFLPAVGSTLAMRELNEFVSGAQERDAQEESGLIIVDDNCSPLSPAPSSSTPVNATTPNPAIPSPIPFVARPRGSRATTSDDPALYAICQLCQNKIMSSRLSNLTNHVRRHASLKQFQCVYCIYTHNEMAKVRLHMQHNHKDHLSQPLDALTPEMQSQWDSLMEQCFPGYSKANSENSNSGELEVACRKEEITLFACIECGQRVASNVLTEHLDKNHRNDCVPYSCEDCGYRNADQWKVRLHITLKHSEKAAEVNVEVLEAGSNLEVFLHKYFPEVPADEEETRMLLQFQNLAPKEEPRSSSPAVCDNSRAQSTESDIANGQIRCELCQKQMPNNRSLSSLMNHAKRHYHLKQYQCSECVYTSSEAAHVRTHMAIKHPQVGAKPIDNNSETLQSAWIEVMRKCFPVLVTRIDQFRFKHSRGEEDIKEEMSEENYPDASGVRGKRKSALRNHYCASPVRKLTKLQNGKEYTEHVTST